MTSTIALAFAIASTFYQIPPGLLRAVCFVESGHKPAAFVQNDGGSASIGICQIKLGTARLVGFKGTAEELARPTTNIFWAGKYLGLKLHSYQGDILKAVAAYNAGRHRYNQAGLTVNRRYVSRVFTAWGQSR